MWPDSISKQDKDSISYRFLFLLPRLALGGEERFIFTLLEQLTQRGCAVSVCATAAGPHPWQAAFAQHTPDVFVLSNFLHSEDCARFLVEHIQTRRIATVLIASSLLGYSLLPYLRAHCPDVVFVDYVHMVDEAWRAGGYARVSLYAHSRLDLTMTSSAHARDWLVAQGAEAARVAICPTSIDAPRWDPAHYDRPTLRRALNLPEARPVILYTARLDSQKRPALLIDVLTRLRQRGLAFTGLIAGDGPQRARLQRAIARRRLTDSVRWMGAVDPDRIPELMAASDIFCLPSENEGIALSLYEAMAMALPVVAADVGGQRELVTPETGRLIPRQPDEAGAYADALAALLTSPQLRQSLGQAARQRVVEHFPVERLAEKMLELFTQARALAQQAPRSPLSIEEAEAVARQVTGLLKQGALFDHLFEGPPEAIERLPLLQRFARGVKMRWLRPLYFWGLEHGLDWLVPLKLAWRRVWLSRR